MSALGGPAASAPNTHHASTTPQNLHRRPRPVPQHCDSSAATVLSQCWSHHCCDETSSIPAGAASITIAAACMVSCAAFGRGRGSVNCHTLHENVSAM
jgi:hypothetical protein